jgi:hypothetical protein
MFAALLIGRKEWSSRRCVLTWKLKGTTFSRSYFLLQASALHTNETEFGLLPTPTLKNVTGGAVQVNENGKRQNKGGTEFSAQMHDLAKSGMLPTPATRDYKGARKTETLEAAGRNETNSLPDAFAQAGKSSQLNPRFVAEMMGFPPNWTELPFQSGEQNQLKDTETQ